MKKMMKIKLILPCLFIIVSVDVFSISLYTHPEIAEENSIFLNLRIVDVSLAGDFEFLVLNTTLDYLPPFSLPFFLGFFMVPPSIDEPNLKHFGPRAGYHIDLENEKLDLYAFYSLDFGWLRNDDLVSVGDTPVEMNFYDFRIGLRFFFNANAGLFVESGFKFKSVDFGLSVKLN
jgi:hypothetical protein